MERRTRLFALGEWETPVFDSDTSDQPPTDYLLYGPHRELTVVHEIVDAAGRVTWRWSGIWSQTSRRKYAEHSHRDLLTGILTWPEIQIPDVVQIPPALARAEPEPAEEDHLPPSACVYGDPGERLCGGQYFTPGWCCGNRAEIGIRDRFITPDMST